jgi:hypothetical protein
MLLLCLPGVAVCVRFLAVRLRALGSTLAIEKGLCLMSIQDVSPEQLAELLHHYQRALAPDFGCPPQPGGEAWEEMPQPEKSRLIAAARLAVLELAASGGEGNSKRYFARPGEAEWGC